MSKVNFNSIKELQKITRFPIEYNINLVKPNGPNNSKIKHPPNSFSIYESCHGLSKGEKRNNVPWNNPIKIQKITTFHPNFPSNQTTKKHMD